MDLLKESTLIYSIGVALDVATTEIGIDFLHGEEENPFVRLLLSYGALGILTWILLNVAFFIAIAFGLKGLAARYHEGSLSRASEYATLAIAVLRLIPGLSNIVILVYVAHPY